MSREAEMVELFEYKVMDLQEGREPKGGKRSVNDLREHLLNASLDSVMMRRVRAADRAWRALQAANPSTPRRAGRHLSGEEIGGLGITADTASEVQDWSLDKLSELPVDLKGQLNLMGDVEALPMAEAQANQRNEWNVLSELRSALFQAELRSNARQQVRVWLREPQLATIRLAYALSENLERGAASMYVPPLHDAFSSLHRPEIAAQVIYSLMSHLDVQVGDLPKRYLQVRSALFNLTNAPFPDISGAPATDTHIRAAEEQLSLAVRQALLNALQQGPDAPRSSVERPSIRSAAGRLLAFLESVVPRSSGGQGQEWPLLEGLLYAKSATLRLNEPAAQTLSLAIHLTGGTQTTWRGQSITWKPVRTGAGAEEVWEVQLTDQAAATALSVGGLPQHALPDQLAADATETAGDSAVNIVRLSSARPEAESQFAGQPVRLVLIGDDLALELRPVTHTDLYPLSIEARLIAALLESGSAYANMRLTRAAAQLLRGSPISADKVSEASASRYAAAPPETLLTFARQGAQTLLGYAARGDDDKLSRAFAEARTFLKLSRTHSEALLSVVRLSLQIQALPIVDDDSSVPEVRGDAYVMLLFRGEPLTVRVNDRSLTLRSDYKGDLCAVMPGFPAAPVRDLLVVPMPLGGITIIRAGERVAVGFQPQLVNPLS